MPIYENSGIPFSVNVKNISGSRIAKYYSRSSNSRRDLVFSENDLFMTGEEPYEFLEYKDKILKFKIPKDSTTRNLKYFCKSRR